MNHYSHRGQILPLKNQMVPTSRDTTLHAPFDKNLDGFGKDGRIKPVGPTHAIYMSTDNKIMGTFGAGINPQNTDFHISLWVRPDDTSTNQAVLGFSKDGDLSKRLYLSIVSGHWAINIGDSAYRVDESKIENRWTFIEMEGSSGTAKLRLDGNLIFTTDYDTTELGNFSLGEKTGLSVNAYSGYISDIRIRFDDALEAYYPCDETDGYVLYDASGNGNDVISEENLSGGEGPTVASIVPDGKFGNAVDISNDGVLEYPIDILNPKEGTIAFWAKVPFELPHDGSRGDYLHMSTTGGRYGSQYSLNIETNSGDTDRIVGIHWASESGNTNHVIISLNTVKKYQNGDWNHFIIAWDKYEGYWLYLNGHLEASSLTSSPLKNFDANTLHFSGMKMDELRIENRVISELEIKAWFESSGYHNHMDDTQVDDARGELEGLEVVGRNLLRNGDFKDGLSGWGSNSDATVVTDDGRTAVKITKNSGIYRYPTEVEEGQIYTVSFYAKALESSSRARVGFLNQSSMSGPHELTDEVLRYSMTFTGTVDTSQNTYLHIYRDRGSILVTDIKLEKGNITTDWTPAPEDIEAKITKLN